MLVIRVLTPLTRDILLSIQLFIQRYVPPKVLLTSVDGIAAVSTLRPLVCVLIDSNAFIFLNCGLSFVNELFKSLLERRLLKLENLLVASAAVLLNR